VGKAPEGRGLLDTSVVIALGELSIDRLPDKTAISTLTLAELTAGPQAVGDKLERARRQKRLQLFEAGVDTLDFDPDCARSFGSIYVATVAAGRKARGARAVDLMIAATALAHDIPLFTMNAEDLRGLEDLIEIVDVGGG
jgi:predicted nucleic acid-binding protein